MTAPVELLRITAEDQKEIAGPAATIVATARDFKIVNHAGYEAAANHLQLVKGAQKALAEKKKTVMDPLNAAVKAARALFAEPEARLEEAEGLFKRSMLSYQAEQERQRAEAQRKLDEAARKERERVAREAEAARQRAEEQRRAAEEAKRAGDAKEAARLAALAEQNVRKADDKADAALAVVPAVVQQEAPKVGGIATRENWFAVVIDKMALVKAIAEGKVPLVVFEPNMVVLNKQAKALKRELAYPGVQACVEKGIAAGSR